MNPKIRVGSTCKLQGLVIQPQLNDSVVVEVREMPSSATNGRVAVARLDSDENVLMHLKPECVVPCCAHCHNSSLSSGQKLKNCSGCEATFYCSATCQTAAWKGGHKFLCAAIKLSSEEALTVCEANAAATAYRLIDKGISVEEELLLLRLCQRLEVDHHMTTLKDMHRDDLITLQDISKKAYMEGRTADFTVHNNRLLREIERQVTWSTTIDDTDSTSLLAFKGLLQTILRDMSNMPGCRCPLKKEMEDVFNAKSRKTIKERAVYEKALEAAIRAKHPELGDRCCELPWLQQFCPLVKPALPAASATVQRANPHVNRPPWYKHPSPLQWDHSWDIIKVKMNHGGDGGHMFRFLESMNMAPTRKHEQKKTDFHARFYKMNYPKDAWSHYGCQFQGYEEPGGVPRRPLPYWQHLQLHRQAHAKTTLKPDATVFGDDALLLLGEFLRTHDVAYPNIQVGRCDSCGIPTLGECLCGESYCSAACPGKDWNVHEALCTQVLQNCVQYCLFVPLSWGQKAHKVTNSEYDEY